MKHQSALAPSQKSVAAFNPAFQDIDDPLIIEDPTGELPLDWLSRPPESTTVGWRLNDRTSQPKAVGELYSEPKINLERDAILFPWIHKSIQFYISQQPTLSDSKGHFAWKWSTSTNEEDERIVSLIVSDTQWKYTAHGKQFSFPRPSSMYAQWQCAHSLAYLDLSSTALAGEGRCRHCGQWLRGSVMMGNDSIFMYKQQPRISCDHDSKRCTRVRGRPLPQTATRAGQEVALEESSANYFELSPVACLRRLAIIGGYLSESGWPLSINLENRFYHYRSICGEAALLPLAGLGEEELVEHFGLARKLVARSVFGALLRPFRVLFRYLDFRQRKRRAELANLSRSVNTWKIGDAKLNWRFYDVLHGHLDGQPASLIVLRIDFGYNRLCAITDASVKVVLGNKVTEDPAAKEPEKYDSKTVPFATEVLFPQTAKGPPSNIQWKSGRRWRLVFGLGSFSVETPEFSSEKQGEQTDNAWLLSGHPDFAYRPFQWQRCFNWDLNGDRTKIYPIPRRIFLGMVLQHNLEEFSVDVLIQGKLRGIIANGKSVFANWRQLQPRTWDVVPIESTQELDLLMLRKLMMKRYNDASSDDLYCDEQGCFSGKAIPIYDDLKGKTTAKTGR